MAYGSAYPASSDSLATSAPQIRANFSYLETIINPTFLAEEHLISGVGEIRMFGGVAAAVWKGWLICDGAEYNRTNASYAGLYSVIGETYGVGDGANTFNVPSFCNVFVRGVAATPGGTGGNDSHAHTNTLSVDTFAGGTSVSSGSPYIVTEDHAHTLSGSIASGDNIPKYGTAIYIIKR